MSESQVQFMDLAEIRIERALLRRKMMGDPIWSAVSTERLRRIAALVARDRRREGARMAEVEKAKAVEERRRKARLSRFWLVVTGPGPYRCVAWAGVGALLTLAMALWITR